jgi:RNA polymerase sigma factor (sigma-70 family)
MNMTANDHDLLGEFTREHAQDAFTALVDRHMNLVYSAALRQVRSPQLAEEVSQTVFTLLARNAPKLKSDTILSAWLYQVTRNTAIDVIRSEARRQAREQIAFQMSDMNDTSPGWTRVEPLLDEAMESLDATDRTAILLRYFENKSLREVGEALGASEDAAQKRVQRAVERLREFLVQRKVTVGASGLAVLLAANAVQAAPSGLAAAVAAGAVAASAPISTSAAVAITKTIAMTTLQKSIIAALVAGAVGAGIYEARVASNLRAQVQALKQQQEQQVALSNQARELQRDRDRATNALAALVNENAARKKGTNEVLKLRGEVGRLRQENAQLGATNALSKATATPEARKMLRDMQKLGMSAIYKAYAQQAKLTPEQTDKLNDLLADHIMDGIGQVTAALRDKPALEEINRLFASQETALQQQIEALVGQDGLAQYNDYTKDLLATLSADQFKGMLSGTDAEKDQKASQLRQLIQQGTQTVVANAGLPADYQTVPMLNLANIASEQQAEQSLKVLDDIYQSAAAGAGSFLSPAELAKFQEFRTTAISNSRGALSMNRAMMAPISN